MTFLSFKLFNEHANILHFVTTREGGVSEGKYSSFNLSINTGDDPGLVKENRDILANRLAIQAEDVIFAEQCHQNKIRIIHEQYAENDLAGTDGMITKERRKCLCILTADCVPVIMYDPAKKVIAAAHAGWRGTAGKIVTGAVDMMVRNFEVNPRDILAGIGPAIAQEKYEVGDEVADRFMVFFTDQDRVLKRNFLTGKQHIDLQVANRILLQRAGLLPEHIEVMNICTYQSADKFYSARRDGTQSGRFATGIMIV